MSLSTHAARPSDTMIAPTLWVIAIVIAFGIGYSLPKVDLPPTEPAIEQSLEDWHGNVRRSHY
ncbi:MAG: hypothetical protein AAFV27_11915 [Pseudomonadota bacterium]